MDDRSLRRAESGSSLKIVKTSTEFDPNGVPIFFKLEDRVKKAVFKGKTLAALRDLFVSSYKGSGWSLDNIPTLHIADPKSSVVYELEDVADLYPKRNKLVIAMIGLPARGKSFTARKVARYLNWLGVKTQVFNVGVYRRERLGAKHHSDFFDPRNNEAASARMHMAVAAMDDMVKWLDTQGQVAIYDATNSTLQRQMLITSRCQQETFSLMWVESICDDESIIEENIRETKLTSPDYVGVDPEDAAADFRKRIEMYKISYNSMQNSAETYVKLIDAGRQIIINNVRSYLQSKIVFFLTTLHTHSRVIWLSRHGESEFNQTDRLGGDSSLTDSGVIYSQQLANWVMERSDPANPIVVWTSTLKRTIETAQYIPSAKVQLRALDEIDAGEFDGWTYAEIESKAPEEYQLRARDKLNYRYPRGESYTDVIARLEPVIFELERTKATILIIAHQAVLRCLYGYLQNRDPREVPFIPVPLNTVIELQPRAYGCVETRFLLADGVKDADL